MNHGAYVNEDTPCGKWRIRFKNYWKMKRETKEKKIYRFLVPKKEKWTFQVARNEGKSKNVPNMPSNDEKQKHLPCQLTSKNDVEPMRLLMWRDSTINPYKIIFWSFIWENEIHRQLLLRMWIQRLIVVWWGQSAQLLNNIRQSQYPFESLLKGESENEWSSVRWANCIDGITMIAFSTIST